jgi:hypothetical protein
MINIYQKISTIKKILVYTFFYSLIVSSNVVYASGAFDKGTAAGKGNFELNLTINPFNLVSYGQNYGVLSYGIHNRVDIVSYYSMHKNGTQSYYFGGFYQFLKNNNLDLGTGVGIRKTIGNGNDLFFPQLLYNIKLSNNFTIGGSFVQVIDIDEKLKNKGSTIDVTLYTPLTTLKKISPKIIEAYFGIGIFKNTATDLRKDNLYLQYSVDMIFNFKKD